MRKHHRHRLLLELFLAYLLSNQATGFVTSHVTGKCLWKNEEPSLATDVKFYFESRRFKARHPNLYRIEPLVIRRNIIYSVVTEDTIISKDVKKNETNVLEAAYHNLTDKNVSATTSSSYVHKAAKKQSWFSGLFKKKEKHLLKHVKTKHSTSSPAQRNATKSKAKLEQTSLPTTVNASTDSLISAQNTSDLPAKNKTVSSTTKPPKKKSSGIMSSMKTKKKEKAKKTETNATSGFEPDKVITAADLEYILKKNGYVRASDLESNATSTKTSSTRKTKALASDEPSKGVALPQQSVLTFRDVQIGSAIFASILGTLLAISVAPNLWLIGGLIGIWYGQKVAPTSNDPSESKYPLSNFIVDFGRAIAKGYLTVYDIIQTTYFMYKTGQLSYNYYKRYAKLDEKYRLSDKMDAWNARFQEGKKNFDKWERENEVGRKILAGLRTVVLVDQASSKRTSKKKKKYRIAQFFEDIVSFTKKFLKAIWKILTGGGTEDLNEIWTGIRIQLTEMNFEEVSQRIGSGIAALVAINFLDVFFASAPSLLGFLALGAGCIFPEWVRGAFSQVRDLMERVAARGRGEVVPKRSQRVQPVGRYDRDRYHYFLRDDGTKRWYRTGQSKYTDFSNVKQEEKGFFGLFQKKENEKRGNRNQGNDQPNWWVWNN